VLPLKTSDAQDVAQPQKLSFLRRVKSVILGGRLLSAVKRRLRPYIINISKYALRRPWFKRSVLATLSLTPQLKNKLYRIVWKDISLPPRAMRIYTALSNAIPTHSKGNE
jgi:hypothetical protein